MPERVFFQCSLPRVGSTMFQNLMNQDERFFASGNSGLLDLVNAANQNYLNSPEFKAQDPELMRKAFQGFCRESIHGFYNAITDRRFTLDKSRGNFANYSFVESYYPNPRIICFVRNMPDIFASLEKLFRKNQHKSNAIVNHSTMQGISTPKRISIRHQSFLPMMEAFSKSIVEGTDKKMLFVKYESFCLNPEKEMSRVYDYLHIPYRKHDFNNIPQTIKEDEDMYEEHYTGLLKIRPQLGRKPSDAIEILGSDVYSWIMETYKGYNEYFGYK